LGLFTFLLIRGGVILRKFRGKTNAFSIGSSSSVLTIPKEVVDELGIDTVSKKTYFDIYTDYKDGKKRIIYEFTQHAKKGEQ